MYPEGMLPVHMRAHTQSMGHIISLTWTHPRHHLEREREREKGATKVACC